jgi:P4 family phage/plasmid primase-like protien
MKDTQPITKIETIDEKKAYLNDLYLNKGKQQTDLRLSSAEIDKEGNIRFSKWLNISQIGIGENSFKTNRYLKKCNQREQLRNEIILEYDIKDEKTKNNPEKAKILYLDLCEQLEKDNISFTAYATDEYRALRIETFWDKLGNQEPAERKKYREFLIKKYNCDLAFITDKKMCSFGIHFKTNKQIKVIRRYKDQELNRLTLLSVELMQSQKPKETFNLSLLDVNNYYENVLNFHKEQPFFYDENGIFWFWNKFLYKYEIVDDISLINALSNYFERKGEIKNSVKREYINFFQQIGRKNKPAELEGDWVQFKDRIYNLKNNEEFIATPKLLSLNPISYSVGLEEDTPIIDKLFKEWVGDKLKEYLYEVLAYCCINSYPLHYIFVLLGSGRNGKGQFLNLSSNLIGKSNICSSELDYLMGNRFETSKLYKKLVCQIGETNFNTMANTSKLKRLSGGDLINYEFKNKNPFDDYNYAKIIISTNTLPTTTDRTDGFYRRWRIIPFTNQFTDKKDVLSEIPKYEYNNLAKKCLRLAKKIIQEREFCINPTIEEQKQEYEAYSNPIGQFLKEECILSPDYRIEAGELYEAINKYLKERGHREHTNKEMYKVLTSENNFEQKRIINQDNKYRTFYLGLNLKQNLNKKDMHQAYADQLIQREVINETIQ